MADNTETMSSFLDTGLDFSSDELTPQESDAFLAWNSRVHGSASGGVELAGFARFLVEFDPGGLKRLRRHIMAIDEPAVGDPLPLGAAVLMWVYSYCVMGSKEGTLYEVIAARDLGASKREIVDLFRLAGFAGGPFGLNAASALTAEYLRAWPDTDGAGLPWPEDWRPDPAAFESGIDLDSNDLSAAELDLLRAWYHRVYGEVPGHVDLAARLHPGALKTMRVRFERMLGTALPARLAPLLMLHSATLRGTPVPARRAAQLAIALGAAPSQIVSTVYWAAVYNGDAALEPVLAAVADVIDA